MYTDVIDFFTSYLNKCISKRNKLLHMGLSVDDLDYKIKLYRGIISKYKWLENKYQKGE